MSSFSSSERSSSSLLEIPISSASVFLIVERKRHEWHEILHRSQLLPTLMCLRFHTLPKTALSIALSYTHLTRRINEINSTHTSHIKQKISRHSQRNYVVRYNKEPPGVCGFRTSFRCFLGVVFSGVCQDIVPRVMMGYGSFIA